MELGLGKLSVGGVVGVELGYRKSERGVKAMDLKQMDGLLLHRLCPFHCFFCSSMCRYLMHWKLVLEEGEVAVEVGMGLVLEVEIAVSMLVLFPNRFTKHSRSHPSGLCTLHP